MVIIKKCMHYLSGLQEGYDRASRANACRVRAYQIIQDDVGSLPMADESFDIVVSMKGFHAFPDKRRAFSETWRVLKTGGDFIGCFCIKGKSKRTDWLVRDILAKKGGLLLRSKQRRN